MIAVDTTILVYAHRADSLHHQAARSTLEDLASDHLARLAELVTRANVRGPKIHDARIAAICIAHGVDELLTADRDFSYFPALRTRNPLITPER